MIGASLLPLLLPCDLLQELLIRRHNRKISLTKCEIKESFQRSG